MVVIAHVATDFKQNPPAIALINSHMATRYPLSLNADILVTFVTDKFSRSSGFSLFVGSSTVPAEYEPSYTAHLMHPAPKPRQIQHETITGCLLFSF
jgi:hypothetical protein